jgi:oligosaccharide repeat unit polymerase
MATGSFLSPGTLFAFYWSTLTLLPVIFEPGDPVTVAAVAWIAGACVVVFAGSTIGYGGIRVRIPLAPHPPSPKEVAALRAALYLALAFGTGSVAVLLRLTAVDLGSLLRLETLVLLAGQLYAAAVGGFEPTGLTQLLLPFVYLGPALGGLLFGLSRQRLDRASAIASLLPALLTTVLWTTKAATLFGILLWTAAYLVARLRLGDPRLFRRQHLIAAALTGAAIATFLLVTSLLRLGGTGSAQLEAAMARVPGYAFGHLTAFSQWLETYRLHPDPPAGGAYTFAGSLARLGLGSRVPGIYAESVSLASGDQTNVYTAFRSLIEDFTPAGALAALAIVGFIGGWSFKRVTEGHPWAGAVLLGTYAATFWSPVTALTAYNSLLGALVLVAITLRLAARPGGTPS